MPEEAVPESSVDKSESNKHSQQHHHHHEGGCCGRKEKGTGLKDKKIEKEARKKNPKFWSGKRVKLRILTFFSSKKKL